MSVTASFSERYATKPAGIQFLAVSLKMLYSMLVYSQNPGSQCLGTGMTEEGGTGMTGEGSTGMTEEGSTAVLPVSATWMTP